MKLNWKYFLPAYSLFLLVIYPLEQVIISGKQFDSISLESFTSVLLELSSFVVFMLYPVFTYLVMNLFFEEKKWLKLLIGISCGILIVIFIRYFLEQEVFYYLFRIRNYTKNYPMIDYIQDNLYFALRFTLFGIIYYFVIYSLQKEKEKAELRLENKQLEVSLLKAQLNPHFLLNSLNSIYALVYQQSRKALPAIEQLSSILKYGLYEVKPFIPLQEELDYIGEYIELQKIRTVKNVQFEQKIAKELLSTPIPHFLLFPLVENVFKHGDLNDPIRLTIEPIENFSLIQLSNSIIHKDENYEFGGIGLENTKKRLQLIYGNTAKLEIVTERKNFELQIKLPR